VFSGMLTLEEKTLGASSVQEHDGETIEDGQAEHRCHLQRLN
jgi:hypothetical protein